MPTSAGGGAAVLCLGWVFAPFVLASIGAVSLVGIAPSARPNSKLSILVASGDDGMGVSGNGDGYDDVIIMVWEFFCLYSYVLNVLPRFTLFLIFRIYLFTSKYTYLLTYFNIVI